MKNLCLKKRSLMGRGGFTLVEMLVAVGLGMLVMGVVASLGYFAVRSFVLIGNYSEMGRENRYALDIMLREIRKSTSVVSFQTNNPKSLTLTNAIDNKAMTISWDATAADSPLVFQMTGQEPQNVLVGCDSWDFTLYQRTPNISATNISFYAAMDTTTCKLIDMSWIVSRTVFGKKINGENLQSAQIVLRNKQ